MPLSQRLSMPLGPRTPTKPEQTCAFSYLGPGLSPTLTPREWGQLYSYPDLVPLLVFSASFPETTCLPAFFLTSNKYLLSTNKMRGSVLWDQDAHLPHRAYSVLGDGNKQSNNYITNEIPMLPEAVFSCPPWLSHTYYLPPGPEPPHYGFRFIECSSRMPQR